VDSDALSWLGGQLGADQAVTRNEVEKLALYAGQGGQVDLTAARVCVGDLSGMSLDDALFAATAAMLAGRIGRWSWRWRRGHGGRGAARGVDACAEVATGQAGDGRRCVGDGRDEAVRPPVFYKVERRFCRRWGSGRWRRLKRLAYGYGSGAGVQANRVAGGNDCEKRDRGVGAARCGRATAINWQNFLVLFSKKNSLLFEKRSKKTSICFSAAARVGV